MTLSDDLWKEGHIHDSMTNYSKHHPFSMCQNAANLLGWCWEMNFSNFNEVSYHLSSSGILFPSGPSHLKSLTSSGFCTCALHVKKRFLPTGMWCGPCGITSSLLRGNWRLITKFALVISEMNYENLDTYDHVIQYNQLY